jgi:hypothetical protein
MKRPKQITPDGYVDRLQPRHSSTDAALLKRLEVSMRKNGWVGRPLLVARFLRNGGYSEYEAITGSHRAEVAMDVGIPIPAVFVDDAALTEDQWEAVMGGIDYGSF